MGPSVGDRGDPGDAGDAGNRGDRPRRPSGASPDRQGQRGHGDGADGLAVAAELHGGRGHGQRLRRGRGDEGTRGRGDKGTRRRGEEKKSGDIGMGSRNPNLEANNPHTCFFFLGRCPFGTLKLEPPFFCVVSHLVRSNSQRMRENPIHYPLWFPSRKPFIPYARTFPIYRTSKM